MAAAPPELRSTIDRAWLDDRLRAEPLVHAYAVWDLERVPTEIRFVSAVRGETTVGYALVWFGRPPRPVVHLYGPADVLPTLAGALPPPPFVAVVPADAEAAVAAARGPVRSEAVALLARDRGVALPTDERTRRLTADDRGSLSAWATTIDDPEGAGYPRLDPGVEAVWAGFDHGGIVGAVHASVRLPSVWILGGVVVRPDARAQGWGGRIVAAAARAAESEGATAGLYVREKNGPAWRLYERLGFRPAVRRRWLEVGAPPPP